jgi:hypothetical protein
MPQFYEIRLFTGVGYFSLLLFSVIAYVGGGTLPLGLAILLIPFIIELIISIYYIKVSKENKRIHFLCFSLIIFIMAFFIGIKVDVYRTENTKKYLINMGNMIEEYKIKNDIEYLMENDIENINLHKNIQIELINKEYRLFFRDGIYNSDTKEIYFRPRP